MATTAEQLRSYRGPAILSFGFRPFFLLGAIWSAAAVAIWLPLLGGSIDLPIAYSPIEWHVHELLYG
ncbi:MAG TPA: NnrS family protein, partial [Hyphomicrobiaceae bacterium]|nr:NnrS family protein [Hyphomicrobiaceae bacterium]